MVDKIGTVAASAGASVDFTWIGKTYKYVVLIASQVLLADVKASFKISTNRSD